ncbi:hypothetical protein A6U87_21240 [Rhizobium sp. AC44/96]|uniref:hypothetical protein n=1 Tax=unclassified Rhizobium TaxID=2613769 RepID=UPI00080F7875|nr:MULTISPECIES: hypothetical protein [unclassified Rhizobium]MDM9623338.1 hypothetical protein [Rhizobium sp. S96]OCJ17355.1 hypothetical protein A6U87_21240 [Rhizobium sp. AC44/96]
MTTLTPAQIRGLKLTKEGDLHPQGGKRWTLLNATITYARTDRFKERPIKVKFATTDTLGELREGGFLKAVEPEVGLDLSPHEITMAGKLWLLKHK